MRCLWKSLGGKKKLFSSLNEDKVLNQNTLSSSTPGPSHSKKKFMKLTEKSNVLKRSRLDPPHPLTHPKMTPLKKKKKHSRWGLFLPMDITSGPRHGSFKKSVHKPEKRSTQKMATSFCFVCLFVSLSDQKQKEKIPRSVFYFK